MSAENPVQQLSQEELDKLPLPQTRGELRELVAGTFDDLLKIPGNAQAIGQAVLAAAVNAIAENRKLRERQANRPVVGRAYYPGSLKAIITAKQESDDSLNTLSVDFYEQKPAEGEEITPTTPWTLFAMPAGSNLPQIVLSQSAVPGDEFFLTTLWQVEAALEAATDATLAAAQQLQEGNETIQ